MNRIKRIVKTLIDLIVSPVSPVLTLAIGWLLTISVTTTNTEFPFVINMMIQHRRILFLIVFAWLIFALAYQYHVNAIEEIRQENKILKAQITEKDRQLNTSSGIILNKFGEFGRFKRIAMFEETMKIIVDNSSMVDSAQLYSYSILNKQNKRVIIKLNAVAGYAQEEIVINSILQTYYILQKNEYDDIKFIIQLWKQLSSGKEDETSWRQWELKNEMFADRAMQLFLKIKKELCSLSLEDLFESHGEIYYNNYRMLTVLYQIMNPTENLNELPISLLVNREEKDEFKTKIQQVENELYKGKRTGVLGSILLEDVFMFRNSGMSSKNGRLYIAFPLEIFEQNYCVLFTIGAEQLKFIHGNEQLLAECEQLKTKFVNIIQKNTT